MLNYTKDQLNALNSIKVWYEKRESIFFYLSGYAGTGKTFLISNLYEELQLKKEKVIYLAFTGQATSILIRKGLEASTIHRLIYTAIDEDYESEINGEKVKSHRIKFVKKQAIPNYELMIVDEVSMVNDDMMKDLMSFGIPILCVGDKAQLPPVEGVASYLHEPNAELTEIVRQAKDNPIIKVATMARNGEPIPYGNYGDVLVLDKTAITLKHLGKLMLGADQILCGKNSTRNYYNKEYRKLKGIDVVENPFPLEGEKIICNVNNWELWLDSEMNYNLVNGTMGIVKKAEIEDPILNLGKISFIPDFLKEPTVDILFDSGIFTTGQYTYDMHQRCLILADSKYRIKKYFSKRGENEPFEDFQRRIMPVVEDMRDALDEEMINRFDWGMCTTVHKYQGSEAKKILLIDESYIFGDQSKNHLYTAITRAKKKLVIIR